MPQEKKPTQDKSYSTGKQQMQQPSPPYDASRQQKPSSGDRASASNPQRNPQTPKSNMDKSSSAGRDEGSPGQSGRTNLNRSQDRGDVSIGNSGSR